MANKWLNGVCYEFNQYTKLPFRCGKWLCATDGHRLVAVVSNEKAKACAKRIKPYVEKLLSLPAKQPSRFDERELHTFIQKHRAKDQSVVCGVKVNPQLLDLPISNLHGKCRAAAVKANSDYKDEKDCLLIAGRDWKVFVMALRYTIGKAAKFEVR